MESIGDALTIGVRLQLKRGIGWQFKLDWAVITFKVVGAMWIKRAKEGDTIDGVDAGLQ